MMKNFISVIIPVYNVESYLKRCVESVLNQTYHNFEIILVDDGSTDGCGAICDDYEAAYARITAIHKKNGGLSEARNFGIEKAAGDYLSFVDADDFLSPCFLERLYTMCVDCGCDLAQCGYLEVSDDFFPDSQVKTGTEVFTGREMTLKIFKNSNVPYIIACNKLYKRELFQSIRFPVGKLHEDEATVYKLLYISDKVAVTEEKLYAYFIRSESIMHHEFDLRRLDYLEALEKRISFFQSAGDEELTLRSQRQYCFSLVAYQRKLHREKKYRYAEKKLKLKYRQSYRLLLDSNFFPLKVKFGLLLFRLIPQLYPFVKRIKTAINME